MTSEDLMKYRPSQAVIELYHKVVAAKTEVERVRPIVQEYKTRILAEHRWTNKGEIALMKEMGHKCDEYVILDPKMEYELSDEDAAIFYSLCNEAATAAGFQLPEIGYCPLLMAESVERDAVRDLMRLFLAETYEYLQLDIDQVICSGLDIYRQMTSVVMKMIGAHVSATDPAGLLDLAIEIDNELKNRKNHGK